MLPVSSGVQQINLYGLVVVLALNLNVTCLFDWGKSRGVERVLDCGGMGRKNGLFFSRVVYGFFFFLEGEQGKP